MRAANTHLPAVSAQAVATFKNESQLFQGYSRKKVSHLVLADGSLFLASASYVAIDGKGQSNDAADAANNIQNVHIGYLLESEFPRGSIFRLPLRLRG